MRTPLILCYSNARKLRTLYYSDYTSRTYKFLKMRTLLALCQGHVCEICAIAEALRTTQWPCMRISENAKTSRAMRTVRCLSAQQAPSANASHWLYTQSAGSDGLGPSPNAFVAPQSLYMRTHTKPQQAAMTMRCANTHCAALKRPAQMCHIICTHNARAHRSNALAMHTM